MKKYLYSLFSVILFTLPITSNSKELPPVLTEWVPFEIIKNHITVQVVINDKPARAIIDTGANVSAISEKMRQELGIKKTRQRMKIHGVVGSKNLRISKKVSVQLGKDFIKNNDFVIFKKLGNIDIILGMDYLQFPIIQLDYTNSRMRFATPSVFKFDSKSAIPLNSKMNALYVDGTINDIPLTMLLDTGNAGNLIIPISLIKGTDMESEVLSTAIKNEKHSGLHKKKLEYFKSSSDNFRIGPYQLENVEYIISTNQSREMSKSAILGYSVLKHFIVTLDLINNKMYLNAN